mmetsp:Transcript_17382/g.25391  ORF Transcript_17382/g.25391 Transcript_17382/m.25391 type:complete len:115 (-) Transcript_17382:73-417(-)
MVETAVQKGLRIKLGSCKRLAKEVASYEKEVVDNEARVQRMREEGKDPYDIRKQEEVLAESQMMVPDSRGRLTRALEDLDAFLEENGEDADIAGSENLENARKLLADGLTEEKK